MTGIVLFVTLLVFLVLNVPVGIAIGLASLAAITTNPRMTDSFIVSQLISTITAPISAVVLLMVGYELNLKKELLGPVLKTIVLRLIIMAGLLVLANMIIFHLFPFDRELEIALMVLYALPAPFIIPIFSDVGKDGEYVSTSLSAHTLVTVILYAVIVVYGMSTV